MSDPIAAFDNAVSTLTNRGFRQIGRHFYNFIGTATAPFFYYGLGERYFTAGSLLGGAFLWFSAAVSAKWFNDPLGARYLYEHNWISLETAHSLNLTQHSMLVGWIITSLFLWLGIWNLTMASQRHISGDFRHSMSLGTSIFGYSNDGWWFGAIAQSIIGFALLFFFSTLGLLFFFSWGIRAYVIAQQRAAAYNRYLDQLDAQIEQKYLKPAMLGQVPPDLTYIDGPLPEKYKGGHLRNNIASASAGLPVTIPLKHSTKKSIVIAQETLNSTIIMLRDGAEFTLTVREFLIRAQNELLGQKPDNNDNSAFKMAYSIPCAIGGAVQNILLHDLQFRALEIAL